MARDLTREYVAIGGAAHVLFRASFAASLQRYALRQEKVPPKAARGPLDLFLSPVLRLGDRATLSSDPSGHRRAAPEVPRYETSRGPGSTADVDYWTSRDVREVVRSH